MRSVLDRAVMWWRFNETLGGLLLLGAVAAAFSIVLLGFSIGRSPAVKAAGVVTGRWGREEEFGNRNGILVRLADGRIARLAQPVRHDCQVGDTIAVWEQPTLLGRRVLLRAQGCHEA